MKCEAEIVLERRPELSYLPMGAAEESQIVSGVYQPRAANGGG
jgi:hypothetical protein